MKDDNLKEIEKQGVEVSSVAKDDLSERISDVLNTFWDSREDSIERIDLEAEPVTTWRFKISLTRKSN